MLLVSDVLLANDLTNTLILEQLLSAHSAPHPTRRQLARMASTHHSPESSESGGPSKSLLVLIPDGIDVEEEARFYDDIVDVSAAL